MKKLKALVARVPAPVRAAAINVAKHFATAFTGTFVVLVKGVWTAPDYHTAKSLFVAALVAATVAGVRASIPLLKALVVSVAKAVVAKAGASAGITLTPAEIDRIIALLAAHPEVVAQLQHKKAVS